MAAMPPLFKSKPAISYFKLELAKFKNLTLKFKQLSFY
uniref:Uncharacterized protein n=1 Tax=Loigolactobacillus rennini TaxID=238013 RepID=A0A1K2I842_9LACO|nr:hypothetical protein LREN565_1024 [Loigolactobacillus rennini]